MDSDLKAPASSRPILVGGEGLWADALARMVESRGVAAAVASSPFEFMQRFVRETPVAAVAGPPFGGRELVALCGGLRSGQRGGPRPALLVALSQDDAPLARDLLTLGADRVMALKKGALSRLAEEMMRLAGLARRVHRRVGLVGPVLLRHGPGGEARRGFSFDLCEGGIGIDDLDDGVLPTERCALEFHLPGDPEPIAAGAEMAWIRAVPGGHRAGARFVNTARSELARIRCYIADQTPLPG